MNHFADRLLAQMRAKESALCVGLDPVYEQLPQALRQGADPSSPKHRLEAIIYFVIRVLRAVRGHAVCVKFQSACFERYGPAGVEAYWACVREARALDLLVIGDVKRGDIGTTSAHYAVACFQNPAQGSSADAGGCDAITVNSYLGADSLGPFLDAAAAAGKGLFALVRTSNPGGDALQTLRLSDGRTVAEAVAGMVAQVGQKGGYVGTSGYSLLGAVVGATKAQEVCALRQIMPHQVLLVPGYGAQGGKAQDLKDFFNPDSTGAVVSASRSIIYAYQSTESGDWKGSVEAAAAQAKEEIQQVRSG